MSRADDSSPGAFDLQGPAQSSVRQADCDTEAREGISPGNLVAWIIIIAGGAIATIFVAVGLLYGWSRAVDVVTSVGMIFFGVLIYFAPRINAGLRDHPNKVAIGVLNIALGWTLLGWVVALVWSSMAIRRDVEYR